MKMYSTYMLAQVLDTKNSAIIVGAGNGGKKLYSEMTADCRSKVTAFFSNDEKQDGSCLDGIVVKKPCKMNADAYIIAVADYNAKIELKTQLTDLGVPDENILFYAFPKDYEYYKNLPSQYYRDEISERYRCVFGHDMNWENPRTYNEIINWEKLNACDERKTMLADKYLVRGWIKEQIGEKYLTKSLGVWDKTEDIDFASLPNRFVLKTNNGSGRNIIVTDKSTLDIKEVCKKLDRWLESNYAYQGFYEMHYFGIQPKIICEEYLEDIAKGAYDYDIFCFHGQPAYVQRVRGAHTPEWCGAFYDLDWNRQPFSYGCPMDPLTTSRPEKLDEMVELSRVLSQGFRHVRIDWYGLPGGRVLFSEMSLSSWAGIQPFHPEEYDRHFGELARGTGME